MKHWILWTGAASLLSIVLVTASQAQNPRSDIRIPNNFRAVPFLNQQLMFAATAGTVCQVGAAECEIKVSLVSFTRPDGTTGSVCYAEAPDVNVKTVVGSGTEKSIVWKLDRAMLDGKALKFHETSGIVTIADGYKQVKNGGYGNGSPLSPPKVMYHVWTKRDEEGAKTGYLPVILWGPAEKEELCAAVDPKIVNVP